MSEQMTKEELLAHIRDFELTMLGAAQFQATRPYRLLDATTRHMHSNTLIQQIAYHGLLVDQLVMRFPQHQPEEQA